MTRQRSRTLTGITTFLSLTGTIDAFGSPFRRDHDHLGPNVHVHQHQHQRRQDPSLSQSEILTAPSATDYIPPTPSIVASMLPSNDTLPTYQPNSTVTIQEAIFTLCPGQSSNPTGGFPVLPYSLSATTEIVSATAVLPDGSHTTFASTAAPLKHRQAEKSAQPTGEARIALGDNGCQTLFAPRVTAICSTTISPVGIPEVTVTDCEQWVTFSSDTKICPTYYPPPTSYTVSMPTVVPPVPLPSPVDTGDAVSAAPVAEPTGEVNAGNAEAPILPPANTDAAADVGSAQPTQPSSTPQIPLPEDVSLEETPTIAGVPSTNSDGAQATSSSDLPILSISVIPVPASTLESSVFTDSSSPVETPSSLPVPVNETESLPGVQRRQTDPEAAALPLSPPSPAGDYIAPGLYYAAAWYDVARGGVPPLVQAVDCEPGNSDNGYKVECETYSEKWTQTSYLRTVTEVRPVTYQGPVVITDGSLTYTTTISIATLTTTTRITCTPTVIKQRIYTDDGPTAVPPAAAAPGESAADEQQPESTTTVTGTVTNVVTVFDGVATSTIELVSGASA
ncbi:uncharacterized protein AB675_1497 [Cyphellophora attinorum]|uniref:Ig-like domain-containing protein n=1 Tax=Cyphellophora attinorum TaxID=1664694 RepID=A0A0N0NJQ8_9EURO|nr:uncharacterized protein AB675_1497 [Phialophora attinorum]KPI37261.1 hypothetical protein AB675_1497 [Phialophora attinorum]